MAVMGRGRFTLRFLDFTKVFSIRFALISAERWGRLSGRRMASTLVLFALPVDLTI